MKSSYNLESNNELTQLIKSYHIHNWSDLAAYVKALPYGRNQNRSDFTLVWKEQKGSCSSKHAFLKHVADLNALPNIELVLGMYKMNTINTPKIGNALSEHLLDYIPEAHCYLKIKNERFDYTSPTSNFNSVKDDILLEKIITAEQVTAFKVDFHKAYIKDWIKTNDIPYSFEKLWQIREQCIANLSG